MNDSAPSVSPAPCFAAPRVRPNAAHAFGGVWRLTVRRYFTLSHWLVVAGMLVILIVFSYPMAPNREAAARSFLPWAATFYVCFLVPLLAFVSAAGVMRDDLAGGSVDYVFTRPVRRPLYVAFRYLAQVVCLQFDFLLALAVVAAVGLYREVPGLGSALGLLLLAQVVVVAVFSAFGFLCGSLTSRYVIVGLAYGAIVEVGLGNVPTQLSRVSMIRQTMGILHPLVSHERSGMGRAIAADTLGTPVIVVVLLLAAAAFLAVAAVVLSRKEFTGAAGRDS